jgi:hypothetical protein
MRMASIIMVLVIAAMGFSCTAGSVINNQSKSQIVKSVENNSPNSSPSPQLEKSIRALDFANFNYPPCRSSEGRILPGSKDIILRGGEMEVGDLRKGEEPVNISLSNVSYHDLTGDTQEEAVVSLTYLLYPHGSIICTYIYTLGDSNPQLLWKHGFGSAAFGGLRKLSVENGVLLVEEYIHSDSEPYCCPKKFLRLFYKWDGKRFQKGKPETLTNEYEDAKFMGYPSDNL